MDKSSFRSFKKNLHEVLSPLSKKQGEIIYSKKPLSKLASKKKLTFGERAADFLTTWAGSWIFIIFFIIFILVWMFSNVHLFLFWKYPSFDPFPFILLNLVLSCLAALQAPIILMSQNRAAQRDRMRAEYDYAVNRKAEKEIRVMREDLGKLKNHFKLK